MRNAHAVVESLACVALVLFVVLGCSCGDDEKKPSEDLSKPPKPLVEKAVPSKIKAEVFPQVGATSARPVAMVVASDPSYCQVVREHFRSSGHVLCIDQTLEVAEPRLKEAAAYLKQAYPRHVAKAPVHLFADAARGEVGWRLMLKEPGFFAHAFLAGLREEALTNITLSALHSHGAKTLAVTLGQSDRLSFLKGVAERRGLTLHPLGDTPDSLKRAISLMKAADERLSPPARPSEPAAPARPKGP